MLDTTEFLDRTETAMVVREDQSLVGNGDTGATTTKDDDGIRYARLVLIIQLINRRLETQLGHPGQVLLVQFFQDPHTLVGISG